MVRSGLKGQEKNGLNQQGLPATHKNNKLYLNMFSQYYRVGTWNAILQATNIKKNDHKMLAYICKQNSC